MIISHFPSGLAGTSFPNGTEWTFVPIEGFVASDLKFANGIWVANGGEEAGIYYSTDGKTFLQSNVTSTNDYELIYNDRVWIVYQSNGTDMYYSTDGKTWTSYNPNGKIRDIIYGDGVWLINREGLPLLYSTNGVEWVETGESMYKIWYEKGIWVGARNTEICYSYDGVTWTKSNIDDRLGAMYTTIYYGRGVWLLDHYYGTGYVYRSTDGKNWSRVDPLPYGIDSRSLYYEGGMWFAVNEESVLLYSEDANTWMQSNIVLNDGCINRVSFMNGIWHLLGDDENYYSEDGKVWTACEDLNGLTIFDMNHANGVWVASPVPSFTDDDVMVLNDVLYSFDGKTWKHSNTSDVVGCFNNNNGVWVALSAMNPGLYYSVTWEPTV